MLAIALLVQGCGGSSDSNSNPSGADVGDVTVGIRDASGHFVRYAVDVTSLQLERANGDVVETIPSTTPIDFSELADLTEFLTVATVPSGIYPRVVMNLDFSHAQIVVQNGAAQVPVVPVDASGNALTTLAVTLVLPDAEPVRIARGIPASMTLDFDLDASNSVDLTTTRATTTVQPFLSVVPEFEAEREHRVRGLLTSVDRAANTVTLDVRPFRLRAGEFGAFVFAIDEDTRFEVNGSSLVGSAGLNALGRLAIDTPIVARGTVSQRTLTAVTVLAGTSVSSANGDVASGVVSRRIGDALTVTGANLDFADGTEAFRNQITVVVGNLTQVTALGFDPSARTKDSISVGQRIVAFGTMTNSSTLDASAGRVRMETTRLAGKVLQSDPLVVNVAQLGGLPPAALDFRGTGTDSTEDADPTDYSVATSLLTLAGVEPNDLVRIRGLVRPFGAAPPAFSARSVVDIDTDSSAALLSANWRSAGGTPTPFSSIAPDRLDVDLADAQHTLSFAGISQDALATGSAVAVVPSGNVRGVYALTVRGSGELRLFRDFAALTPELADQLDSGNRLVRMEAVGRYNATAVELTASRAIFEFATP